MLILPGKHRYRALPWVPNREWREPSLAQPKDCFGRQNRVRFRFIAKGCVSWIGWCDSREDADAFLNAMFRATYLHEPVPYPIWRLPTPHWYPDAGTEVWWATTQSLVSPTGSNQTLTSPSDWNNSNNSVQLIAAGASGAAISIATANGHGTGGGAGEFASVVNFSFATPGTTTSTWQAGTGGTAVAKTNASGLGVDGGDTWWDGATQAGATLGAIHGTGGSVGGGSTNGGAGGTGGVGSTHKAGGRGGNLTGASGGGGSGGGGAGGSTAAGANGGDSTSTAAAVKTAGGNADVGGSGAGSGGSAGQNNGGNGTEFDGTHGSGGGAGGNSASAANATAGTGGNYGGGGGGVACLSDNTKTATSGAGIQGMIFLTYTPAVSMPFFNFDTNQ